VKGCSLLTTYYLLLFLVFLRPGVTVGRNMLQLPSIFTHPPFQDYLKNQHALNVLLGDDGRLDANWETFFQTYASLGDEEIIARNNDIFRLLKENGVTYNIYGDPSGLNRPWKLDIIPFMINRTSWLHVEAGLKQRAELLNLIFKDIYGDRKLIRNGILPMELVYNHAGFLRSCAGIQLPGERQLILYSADIARAPSGQMWVVNDRTQAPSGSGYALENRTTMTRVIPELFEGIKVRHLSPYFTALRNGLIAIAPHQNPDPRIVILTPGSNNETYFEHSFLSSHLGFTLVQGNDLVVKNNFVWLKTLGGLERVDVIIRRVDDVYCDPVELKEDSQLGVPGLLQAIRKGNVALANPLGSGILENPGLMPFLQSIARYFLNEDLILPTIASWWCGQPAEMKYVIENLDALVVKKIHRSATGSSSIDGASLTAEKRAALIERIKADPALYVGQEKVEISYTPSLIGENIEPRKVLFRSFLVANQDEYVAMAGGLCRTSSEPGNFLISNQLGGFSKDAWIITPEPDKLNMISREVSEVKESNYGNMLPSHAAENLFWVGRYTERILGNARFLRTVMQFLAEGNKLKNYNNVQTERSLLIAFTHYSYCYPGFAGDDADDLFADPWKELKDMLFNDNRPGGLKNNFTYFQRAIHEVRDHWSTDTWRVIRSIDEKFNEEISLFHHGHLRMLQTLDDIITAMVAFIGLNRESISREQGWIMLDMGRKIEQSLLLISMLKATMTETINPQVEYNLQQSVLMSNENLVNFRYKYRSPIQVSLVLDLMLFDPNNPRSLTYQVKRLKGHLRDLPKNHLRIKETEYERLIEKADTLLAGVDKAALCLPDKETKNFIALEDFLNEMGALLSAIPPVVSKAFFKHEQPARTIVGG
jgi:uncharacterized circularly permuted ATP-grasp superfamily protein/uncharacterized alpha-E superfamily protein